MVEKVEIQTPETTSEQPSEDKTFENESRPEWLPEKFKSPEDMAKAYGELEGKLGKSEKETEPKKEETNKDNADLSIDKAEKAVENAGLNMSSLQEEYNEGGQLKESSYEALAKAGIPKDYVDAFIKGQEAIATQTSNTLKQEVGGTDAYNNMMNWASDNLNEAEINSFNKTVNGKDIEATRLAIQGLNARYKNSVGDEPSLQSANNPSSTNAPGFRSWAEVTAAMNDDRYASDEAYRADIQNKLNNSRL
ncbi:putative scaffolding protein [Pelagibacter phage Hroenn EXVC015P]|nr:putative scaffolding protein [Pelagibacter phage Bylgja EXVC010P]QLF88299.1 putative scaffolding protein [Pelagibacter phage Himinglaeva EXVC011P]QLF88356.1 putative scaffolding protein [Pelagibacter phage Hroenn EXVC015P]QLF88597.1 putative scaffolding protein [Pelagibacter phage Unn EXVC019P]